ncbi:MAG: restriction endonuclease subunit S [Burkholderiaceae bacterium]
MRDRWPEVRIADVADLVRGVTYAKDDARSSEQDGYVPVLRATNIQAARLVLDSDLVFVPEANVSATQKLRAGDIVVATSSGSKHLVGKSALLGHDWGGSFGAFCAAIRPAESVDPRYLASFLQSPSYWKQIGEKSMGVNINNLRRGDIESVQLPLPDLDEQRRIVADIDKQFSRLDEAVASLQRVKANLKRYKAAVLKAAVEGRLVETEASIARREGRNPESGETLLARILQRRAEKWSGKGEVPTIKLSSKADLPSLPDGWTWCAFGVLGEDPFSTVQTGPFGAQLHNTDFCASGVPVIAVGNLTGTGFKREGLYFVGRAKADQLARYDVWAGDILFARSGATLGKVCVAPDDVADWRMTGHILRARLHNDFLDPHIAVYALSSMPAVTRQVFASVRGATRPGFNTTLLESIWIPVPPRVEQVRIVAEVERRLSILSGIEADVEKNLRHARALRQAVLSKSFSI